MLHAGYNITSSDGLVAQAGLGDEANICGAQYKYCKSAAAIAQYAACTVADTQVAQEATTTTAGSDPQDVVIPQFAIAAADEYFWAPVGPFTLREDSSTAFYVKAATLDAENVKQYTTGTAGVVDDSATTLISGLKLTSTNAAGGTVATPCVAVGRLGVNKS